MARRYEISDYEWEQIKELFPKENTGKPGRPAKDNRTMLNAMVWLVRSGAAWRDLPESMAHGKLYTAVSVNGQKTGLFIIYSIF